MTNEHAAVIPGRHRIVAVTAAGRRHYLELMKHYVLRDKTIDEWQLWDNCRTPEDRAYLSVLEAEDPRIRIVRIENPDGTNRSVNLFYPKCSDHGAFYIKLDDDLVYLDEDFSANLYTQAVASRNEFIWWSPLVINNAVCSWLLKYHSGLSIPDRLSCQASDAIGWRDPAFAEKLHLWFLSALERKDLSSFRVPDFNVSLSRFSINAIGFFGEDVDRIGADFCPPGIDDEEWISAVLPSKTHRPGRVVGRVLAAHFSFFTQEAELLRSGILDRYYHFAGVAPVPYRVPVQPRKQRIIRSAKALLRRLVD